MTIQAVLAVVLPAIPVLYALRRGQRERALLLKDAELVLALDGASDAHKRLKAHLETRVRALVDREEYGVSWRHSETVKAGTLGALSLFLLLMAVTQPPGWVPWLGYLSAGLYVGWTVQVLVSEYRWRQRQQERLAAGQPAAG